MKKLFAFLFVLCAITSCSDSSSSSSDDDGSQDNAIYDAPNVRSYVTYTSQNSVMLNGFIDHSNIFFSEEDSYKTGFIFRAGDENDSSNDEIIELEGEVDYYNGFYNFNHAIEGLEPNTTYYYTAYTKNGASEEDDWGEFTTSEIPCTYAQNNYYSIDGVWQTESNPELTSPQCCDEGNVGIRFGHWPDIFEVNFYEIDADYPITAQYFGIDYMFDITYIERELTKSNNQVLIGSKSTPETSLFVENDGNTLTLIFCDTVLRDGTVLNGKISVAIP